MSGSEESSHQACRWTVVRSAVSLVDVLEPAAERTLVGTSMAYLLVHIQPALHPRPERYVPSGEIATLAALTMAATLASALAATAIWRRLRPTEVPREA